MTNWNNPAEHFAWALKFLPTANQIPMLMPPEFVPLWSQHLVDCGFAHRDYLASLADEDGNIHVSKLPPQRIKLRPPERGPRHNLNNAWQWVPVSEPDPEPMNIPDIRELQPNEVEAMVQQFRDAGVLPQAPAQPVYGVVE